MSCFDLFTQSTIVTYDGPKVVKGVHFFLSISIYFDFDSCIFFEVILQYYLSDC